MDEPDPLQASLDELYKAGFKAGREAGMMEAAGIAEAEPSRTVYVDAIDNNAAFSLACSCCASAILSAIGGGK